MQIFKIVGYHCIKKGTKERTLGPPFFNVKKLLGFDLNYWGWWEEASSRGEEWPFKCRLVGCRESAPPTLSPSCQPVITTSWLLAAAAAAPHTELLGSTLPLFRPAILLTFATLFHYKKNHDSAEQYYFHYCNLIPPSNIIPLLKHYLIIAALFHFAIILMNNIIPLLQRYSTEQHYSTLRLFGRATS